MSFWFGIMLFIFVIVCILLCLIILIQNDKGGGISGAIGGGFASATSMFGAQDTANVLTRGTTVLASVFMGLCLVMSLFLAHPSGSRGKSLLKERAEKQQNFSPSSVLQGQQGLPMGQQGGAGPQGPGQGAMPQQQPMQQQQAPALPAGAPPSGPAK